VERDYGPGIDGKEPGQVFIARVDGIPVGMIQRYLNRDYPAWDRQVEIRNAAGIDYLIGDQQLTGQGLGPNLIRAFVKQLFDDYVEAECVAVGVLRENRPSWRALEKAGFIRLRSQHLDSDEPWDRGPGYLYLLTRPALSRGASESPA
jgi:aminoglycoside 6'-N-acetyltransferase